MEMTKINKMEISDDSLDAAEAANVMLSLRNGTTCNNNTKPKKVWKVITTSPSQDHTYSAAENLNSFLAEIHDNHQNDR